VRPQQSGYGGWVSESGPDSPHDASARRFEREDADVVTLTDIASEDKGDGSREWCFTVRGLDNTVQAARFATRREAERAHLRLRRAMELLGHRITR
jgi:hypothetical protein